MDTPTPPDMPTEFDRLLAQGLDASRADQRELALDLFSRASAADPSSGVPHFLMASEHATAGDFIAAELSFACAVLLAPDFPLARYQLGLLQYSTKRAAVALVTWQPLLLLPANDALPHFVRAFTALAQDDFAEALAHFRSGLACEVANPALEGDIVQLVDAVEKLHEGTPDPQTDHVLLSAYGRGLH